MSAAWSGPLVRLTRHYAPTWVRRPDGPVRAVVALTRRCNFGCATCRSHAMEPGDELTPTEIGRLCDGMPSLTWLDLTGGEPLIRGDVREVLEQVLAHTPALAVLHFPTNGWFGERAVEAARLVRERRPDVVLVVTVSVDGPPALNDRLRGREGAYVRALDTYRSLREVDGVDVVIGTTVGPDNRDALERTRESLRRDLPGFDDRHWHLNLCQISSHFYGNDDLAPRLDGRGDRAFVRRQLRRRLPPRGAMEVMEVAFLAQLHAHLGGRAVTAPCAALDTTCFVSADGRLYPCHLYDRPLADLREVGMDVRAVWHHPDVASARRDVGRLGCGGCFTPCEAYPRVVGSPVRAAVGAGAELARLGLRRVSGRGG